MLKLRIFLFAFIFSTFTTFTPSHAMEMSREKFVVIGCAVSLGLVGGLYAYSPAFKEFSQKFFQFFCFGKGKEVAVQEEDCRAIVPYEGPESQVKGVQENCREIVLYRSDSQLVGSKFDRDVFEQAYYEIVGNDNPMIKALYQEACEYLLSNGESSLALSLDHIKEQERARFSAYDGWQHRAIQHGVEEVLSGIINERNRVAQAKYWEWLQSCLRNVDPIILRGVNPNFFSHNKCFTPLSYACEANSEEMVRFLLGCQDINVNLSSFHSFTPLERACHNGSDVIVGLLLDAGANVTSGLLRHVLGLLSVGTEDNKYKVVKLLLQHGVKPNMVTLCGETPLFWTKSFDVMKVLVEHGADVKHRRNDGASVLDCMLGDLNLYGAFEKKGAFKKYEDINECVSFFVKNGYDINSRDTSGYTALHRIVQNDRIKLTRTSYVVSVLLNHGADPMIKDNQGKTAFDCACTEGAKKALLDNDPAMRTFEIDTFVRPRIEQRNIAHYVRDRQIGGVRRIAGK